MKMRERPSPNHGPRPSGRIDMLVLHYTGMVDAASALDRLCDPAAEVSAHYLIEEDGTIWRLVEEARRAWHAGRSFWVGERDVNGVSIGIELVNPGHEFGYRPFPQSQMTALVALCRDILGRHAVPPQRVLGHSDVAPQRKRDPGELFDWPLLARAGIGLWPDFAATTAQGAALAADEVQRILARIGYEAPATATFDAATRETIIAFQRHFRPRLCDGIADVETCFRLQRVAAAFGQI
jgi:N-acetylmuramoyl-L-alanine amidase